MTTRSRQYLLSTQIAIFQCRSSTLDRQQRNVQAHRDPNGATREKTRIHHLIFSKSGSGSQFCACSRGK